MPLITKHIKSTVKARAALFLAVAAVFSAFFILSGCTRNNGNIGKIFGQWQLQRVETEGMELPEQPATYWSFQSSTVRVAVLSDMHSFRETYGNFRLEDETLFLDFADERYPELIPGVGRQSEWQLLRLTGKELTVRYQYPDQSSMIWYFKKW